MLYTPRENLISCLRDYGEDSLADRFHAMSEDDYLLIAQSLGALPEAHAFTGMLIAKAFALATVELMEGQPRSLRFKRRRFKRPP